MAPGALHAAALALPGATMDVQWGGEHVYKVGGRMFAVTDGATSHLSFKASDIAYEVLTETGRARPAPYLARAKWITFDDVAALEGSEVEGWLRDAHAQVAARLTRKVRAELGIA